MLSVFLSCVSDELKFYRERLAQQLRGLDWVTVLDQATAPDPGGPTLDSLYVRIQESDVVVHLVGDGCGRKPKPRELEDFLAGHPELPGLLREWTQTTPLVQPVDPIDPSRLSYTQWEYWFACYLKKFRLVYSVSPEAPREKEYRRSDDEVAAQRLHFDQIRVTGHHRGTVANEWNLVARVVISLSKDHGPGNSACKPGAPAVIVIGLQPAGAAYVLRAGLRWRGHFQQLAENRVIEMGDDRAMTEQISLAIDQGAQILRDNQVADGLIVELVLPTSLLFEKSDRWCRTSDSIFGNARPEPLRNRHPLRLRNGDRWARHGIVLDINQRVELLESNAPAPVHVHSTLKWDASALVSKTPISVVDDGGPETLEWWKHPSVVCAAFTRRPQPVLGHRRKGAKPAGPVRRSSIHYAIDFGVPILVWPDSLRSETEAGEMHSLLTQCGRPEGLCEFIHQHAGPKYSVLADCRESPFPQATALRSEVVAPL